MGIQTTILCPVNATGGGHYRAGGKATGLTTLAAGAPVFSFRWINTGLLAVVHKVAWGWFLSTAFGAAQIVDHGLYKATGFSASDTGGSALTATPKRAGAMNPLVAADFDMRIGAISAGTRTLAADHVGARGAWGSAVGANLMPGVVMEFEQHKESHLYLGPNEGLVLCNITLMGASGVLALYVDIAFSTVKPENALF